MKNNNTFIFMRTANGGECVVLMHTVWSNTADSTDYRCRNVLCRKMMIKFYCEFRRMFRCCDIRFSSFWFTSRERVFLFLWRIMGCTCTKCVRTNDGETKWFFIRCFIAAQISKTYFSLDIWICHLMLNCTSTWIQLMWWIQRHWWLGLKWMSLIGWSIFLVQ